MMNAVKIFTIGLFILVGLLSSAQMIDMTAKDDNAVKKEIRWFMEKITEKRGNSNKYIVYVVHLYNGDSGVSELCFTTGYILNEFDYKYVSPNYYTIIGKDSLLVRCNEDNLPKASHWLELKPIDKQLENTFKKKLFPTANGGGFTYEPTGLMSCTNNDIVIRNFYGYEDEIPRDKSINSVFLTDGIITHTDKDDIEKQITLEKKQNKRKKRCKTK